MFKSEKINKYFWALKVWSKKTKKKNKQKTKQNKNRSLMTCYSKNSLLGEEYILVEQSFFGLCKFLIGWTATVKK